MTDREHPASYDAERACKVCGVPLAARPSGRLACKPCDAARAKGRYKELAVEFSDRKGIPCACGCGEITSIALVTDARYGVKAGEPRKYINRHSKRLSPIEYEVEDRGYITPCWIWKRGKDKDGYGLTQSESGKTTRAYKRNYEKRFGPVPSDKVLDHLCKQRDCVNELHLQVTSVAVNTRRGKSTKLSVEQVVEIRGLLATHQYKLKSIGDRFNVSWGTIRAIRDGRNWNGVGV